MSAVVCVSQTCKSQAPTSAPPKDDPVNQLVELTLAGHPSVGVDEMTAKLPKDEMVKRNQIRLIDLALKKNKNLTHAQRSFAKAHYDQIGKLLDQATAGVKKRNFETDKWVEESLQKFYAEKLANEELKDLIAYFQGAAGKSALKYLKSAQYSEAFVKAGTGPLYTNEDKAEGDKFAVTPLGKKFLTIFLSDTSAEVNAKMADANKKGMGALWAINEPANINSIINKFVAENYKK